GAGAGLADAVEIILPLHRHLRIGAPEGILLDARPVPVGVIDTLLADLHQRTADDHAVAEDVAQHLAGNRAGGDPCGRLARGRAPAAAIVADTVFGPVGIVGMAG